MSVRDKTFGDELVDLLVLELRVLVLRVQFDSALQAGETVANDCINNVLLQKICSCPRKTFKKYEI